MKKLDAVLVVLAVATAPAPAARVEAQAQSDSKRSRLPAAVVRAIDENKPGAQIEKLSVETEAGVRFYDMEFKGSDGEMDVAEDGTVLDVSTIVQVADLPPAVAAVVQRAVAGTSIKQLTRSEVRARIAKVGGHSRLERLSPSEYVYEVELARGGEVEIAADGRVIKGPKSLNSK